MQTQEIRHLPDTASPTSELSSKARLPYACITGYATSLPLNLDWRLLIKCFLNAAALDLINHPTYTYWLLALC